MSLLAVEAGPSAQRAHVDAMLDRMRGSGAWDSVEHLTDPELALGVLARWTVPEHEGAPAVVSDAGRGLTLIWDGRIDDHAGLASALHLPRAISEPELVLEAFARWGDASAEKILGEFVFAAYEHRPRRLFVARDRLGIRPAYFVELPDRTIRLASSERALFACGDLEERPSPRMLSRALVGAAVTRTETLREGVRVLPAGSTLSHRNGAIDVRTYYRLDPSTVDERSSRAEHLERIRSALEAAVASRIRGRWPIAGQASGGLDSSSVDAIAARQLRGKGRPPPILLHMRCSGLPCDESRWARSLAKRIEAPLIEEDGGAPSYAPDGPTEIDLGGPWCNPYRALYRRAATLDARIVLTGEGSDELQLRHGLEVEDAMGRSAWLEAARYAGLFDDPLSRRGWSKLARAAYRGRRRSQRNGSSWPMPSWLTDTARAAARRGLEEQEEEQRRFDHPSALRRAACVELTSTVGMTLIMQEVQAFATHHGLELSHPFLDMRVVDAFMALPLRFRTGADTIKPMLRSLMEGALPPAVLWRFPPTDYTTFHERAWRASREAWLERARSSELARLGLVDGPAFRKAVEAAFEGHLTSDVTNALELEGWLHRAR